jgi:hypothetical protein
MYTLESHGFVIVENFIDPSLANLLSTMFSKQRDETHYRCNIPLSDTTKFGDCQFSTSYVGQVLPMFEVLLDQMTTKMEEITKKTLFPTYSYARIYYGGSELARHTDRRACEYSVTVCLQPDTVEWPICISDKMGVEHRIAQRPGDAVVYKGCEQEHWREMFTGTSHLQVFLHWVDQNGPNREWKYDKRGSLNLSKIS